jgi:diguanylate cyclase (GGDEF)-like protein
MMIDMDHFKSINDRFGHQAGDAALQRVADTLVRNFLRKEDFVARYGGEEFTVVVPDTTVANAIERSERLRQAVEALEVEFAGSQISLTVSVGVACLEHGDSNSSWIARADAALYEAKAGGRNRVVAAPTTSRSLRPSRAAEARTGRSRSGANALRKASSPKLPAQGPRRISQPEVLSVRTNPPERSPEPQVIQVTPLRLGDLGKGKPTADDPPASFRPLALPSVPAKPER